MASALPLSAAPISIRPRPARPAAFATSASRRRAHLTTRGRIVLLVAPIAVALGVLASTGSVQASGTAPVAANAHVVVQPGQSLWSIARSVAPQADTRATVAAIAELNGLTDSIVHPGQSLVIPIG